jgi:hypothetical protein
MASIESRIQRLEDRAAIHALAVRYGFAVDERDYATIASLFTSDGSLRTNAGVSKGSDREAVVSYFRNHMPDLGPTNHFVHGHHVVFDENDDDLARGVVSGHAEMVRNGVPMVTALHYIDTYRREDGEFLFKDRVQSYMYFVDVREYADALGSPFPIRASSVPQPGDWPVLT